jgi:DNA-binding beta-propeller fold protein YncE
MGGPSFKLPSNVTPTRDGLVLVADNADGAPAMNMRPDKQTVAQQLPLATANATAVLAIDGDVAKGLIVVSWAEGRVERTGSTAWKRTDLRRPWAAAVAKDTVLVTESGAGRVAVLDLASGEAGKPFSGEGLYLPRGIAVSTAGHVYVSDASTASVHVFDDTGALLRVIGEGILRNPRGLCVAQTSRVYVADVGLKTVVLLDGETDALLSSIEVDGHPQGVCVDESGRLVVSVWNGVPQVGSAGWLFTP